ncbi:unnamed protein product, partial [Symbiodinium necroappetens]
MKRPAEDGEEPPCKRRTLPPIGQVAEENRHVFISLQGYSEKVGKLFDGGHSVVFIRGGVATGKTTLAEHLGRSEKYVNVPFTDHGRDDAWRVNTAEAVQQATGKVDNKVDGDGSAFRNALKQAKDNNLTLIYDEAHTLFSSPDLCSDLFKANIHYGPRVLLLSASGDAASTSSLTVTTPSEITQKFMWTPPVPCPLDLKTQLEEGGIKLDEASIEFFTSFCGGHRGIFIAAMHWVKSKQNAGESWDFRKTVGCVRNSYNEGNWNCIEAEFQKLDWNNAHMEFQVANPLLASYYRFILKKQCALEVEFGASNPRHCADLLMRALPYLFFSKVVSFEGDVSQLAKGGLPHEQQYNQAIFSVLTEIGYKPLAPQSPRKGAGKPDLMVSIGEETFAIEGMKQNITKHLERFGKLENYKNAEHKGLYVIGNDNKKMEKTVRETDGGDVQIIGLVPNIAHTAYTVHVKSKGIELINTFK